MKLLLAALVAIPAPHQDFTFRELLVIERSEQGRRSPVVLDGVEAGLARGTLEEPRAGGEVELAGGKRLTWKPIEAGEGGQFRHRSLSGGWGYAAIERDERDVLLLDASGHRRVVVNGVPRAGDIYGLGIVRVPVKLEAGTNRFFFRGGRGSLRAALVEPPADIYLESRDRTLPNAIPGEGEPLLLGIRIGNATEFWQLGLRVVALAADGNETTSALPPLAPLSVRQLAVRVAPPAKMEGDKLSVKLDLFDAEGGSVHSDSFELDVRAAGDKHKRTFESTIDGSVQYYAVTPPTGTLEAPALFLSLHGASVQATNQAFSYAPKDWGVVVAPTNRRPFGFDWEDWGRLDALEVFDLARERWSTDPRRQYLTGHSMGGHGTWNVGVHFPGTFAAIAPSAGWRDFWSYGTGMVAERDPVEELLDDAANASRTLLLEENYLHAGVYVLHGDADDNVPVDQARYMRARLGAFHPNFAYYERKGAGHWWGNECLDWPPLFDFLAENVLPERVDRVTFATINPAVNARCHWVTIHAQSRSMEVSRVEAVLDAEKSKLEVTTENVARLALDLALLPAGDLSVHIDESEITVQRPESGPLHLELSSDGWQGTGAPDPRDKSPERAGPFKDAFRGRMAFVYGTRGGEERTALLFQKARLDAEVFNYRGNGSVEVVPDTEFDPAAAPDRHVILYGNADDNALWGELLGDSPIEVRDGEVRVGERKVRGDDLVVLFLRPHPLSDTAAVAAVSAAGSVGYRASRALPYFVSGVGYPDWTVIGAEMLERGSSGVRGAGFFGPDWSLESGRSAWH